MVLRLKTWESRSPPGHHGTRQHPAAWTTLAPHLHTSSRTHEKPALPQGAPAFRCAWNKSDRFTFVSLRALCPWMRKVPKMFRHGVGTAVSRGLKAVTLGALVTGALLAGAAPASAHDDDGWRGRGERQWRGHDEWRHREWREHRRWREPGVVVYEAPPPAVIYRAPPTVVYRQPPVVYAPPPPVVYAPGGASLGIGVNIPFR